MNREMSRDIPRLIKIQLPDRRWKGTRGEITEGDHENKLATRFRYSIKSELKIARA